MTRLSESMHKVDKVRRMLRENNCTGVIIQKQPNFSWISSGGRGFIGLATETACASIVITQDGVYLAANNIEGPRLMQEELPRGFAELIQLDWYLDIHMKEKLTAQFGPLKDDTDFDSWFKAARTEFYDSELQRYKTASQSAAAALEAVCLSLRPDQTELEIAGVISEELWALGIEPITMLAASRERSKRFRHFVPTSAKASGGVICSICARSGGLVVSATRSVAFEKSFARNYNALLEVERAIFDSLLTAATLGEVMNTVIKAYDANGLGGEWKNHHQGGTAGYLAREIRVLPDDRTPIGDRRVFAWNPSAAGAKCEDTVLLKDGKLDIMTAVSPKWPAAVIGGRIRPLILQH